MCISYLNLCCTLAVMLTHTSVQAILEYSTKSEEPEATVVLSCVIVPAQVPMKEALMG